MAEHPLKGLLEDRALNSPEGPLLSIAISLKRIADAMTETNEYGETGSQAVGGHVKRAAQEIVSIVHHAASNRR